MSVVLDSSIAVAWFFADERNAAADAVLTQVTDAGAVVPQLWRLEVANALQMSVRRKRIDAAYRNASLDALQALTIAIDGDTNAQAWSTTLRLADQHQLTLYDAAYLELAQRLDLPLATLDQQLRAAAGADGVTVLGM